MIYPSGHFVEPVLVWFGTHWTPSINWKPPKQIATRSSEDGDSLNLKGTLRNWPATRRTTK